MTMPQGADPTLIGNDANTELAADRTGLAFERTRMGADRTLMASVRTSLSLIGFGFTINQVFSRASPLFPNADTAGRRLGLSLLILGVVTLAAGLVTHHLFDRELGLRRARLESLNLLHRVARYRVSPTYAIAMALLAIGLFAVAHVAFKIF